MTVTCQCPDDEHDCKNTVEVGIDDLDIRPIVCTPCLYGCMP